MKNFNVLRFCIAVSVVCLLTASANAVWVEVQKDFNDFGHLGNTTINGRGACAATSLINSFKYLENKHSGAYKGTKKLIPNDDLDAARDALHINIWGPNNTGGNISDVWREKIEWFNDPSRKAPGIFHGMYYGSTAGWDYPTGLIGNLAPNWGFLWDQLAACEDVEIFITNYLKDPNELPDPNKAVDHAVTLISLKYDKDNPANKTMTYLDSNNPTKPLDAENFYDAPNGTLFFRWDNGNNPATDVWIYAAFSESVPEPATVLLLCLGGLALLKRRA